MLWRTTAEMHKEESSMSKPKLALDFDSVLAATHVTAADLLGEDYGYKDIESWDWPMEQFGHTEAIHALWHTWTIRPLEVPPMEENISQKVSALHSKYDVDIVTAQPDDEDILKGKSRWMKEHGIGYGMLHTVPMDKSKTEFGDYDVFIDDKPALPSQAKEGQTVYLRDQPYNREAEGDYIRIDSITDALKQRV